MVVVVVVVIAVAVLAFEVDVLACREVQIADRQRGLGL